MLEKLKQSKHYRLEVFAVLFVILSILSIFSVASIWKTKREKDAKQAVTLAIYKSTFQSSLTKTSGTVVDVLRNKEGTEAFVLLKLNKIDDVSQEADDYQMFLCGLSDTTLQYQPLRSKPSGAFYVFQKAGYVGVYLTAQEGFGNQILKITVRINNRLQPAVSEINTKTLDRSYIDHDQFDLYVNPMAADATVSDMFTNGGIDLFKLYEQTMVRPKEITQRTALRNQLIEMYRLEMNCQEYVRRVEEDGIVVPDRPAIIAGDEILATLGGEPLTRSRDMWLNANGEKVDATKIVYWFKPAETFCGGFDFEWQDGSVSDGYLDALRGELSAVEYMRQQKAAVADNERLQLSELKWFRADGTEFHFDSSIGYSDIGLDAKTQNDIQALVGAWGDLYMAKRTYQIDLLRGLLELELYAHDAVSVWDINRDSGVLLVY